MLFLSIVSYLWKKAYTKLVKNMQEIARNNNDNLTKRSFNNQEKSHLNKINNLKKNKNKKKK